MFDRKRISGICIFASLTLLPLLIGGEAFAEGEFRLITPEGGSMTANMVQMFLLLTVLSVAPGIMMMITCFPFMVTSLSVLRQALGVPQTPPNMMIMSLAMFLTFYVMQPVFEKSWENGVRPYMDGKINEEIAFERSSAPFRTYMESRVSVETSDFMRELAKDNDPLLEEIPLSVLVPSYMISEIERAFKVGFLIFIPFVIIDLVISALLMSMGMMMLPPSAIALPVKLAFFTLSNGWSLVATALVKSYAN